MAATKGDEHMKAEKLVAQLTALIEAHGNADVETIGEGGGDVMFAGCEICDGEPVFYIEDSRSILELAA
jgi:hypothetical protein